jgi:hypothetical protein
LIDKVVERRNPIGDDSEGGKDPKGSKGSTGKVKTKGKGEE